MADEHDVKVVQDPIFGVVVFDPDVKAQNPSDPPPEQASLAIYEEHVD